MLAGANTTPCGAKSDPSHEKGDHKVPTDEETNRVDVSVNSLGVNTAQAVESSHDLTDLETDFVCSRVMVDAIIEQTGAPLNPGPLWLILARGDTTIAQISAAMDGTNNYDRTPTAGEDQQVIKRALQNALVLKIPATNDVGFLGVSSTERLISSFKYNGPPLGMSLEKGSKRSWMFPRDIGWRWFFYNSNGIVMSGDSALDATIKMRGVWTQ